MSDNEMQSTEKANTRTVSIRAEIWHALLKIAGRQIDPENAEVHWRFGQVVDSYEVYPISRPSVIASDVAISPGLLEPWCGSNLEICLRQLARRSGCGLGVYPQSSTTNCLSKEIAVLPW